jgi:hypothetical protein
MAGVRQKARPGPVRICGDVVSCIVRRERIYIRYMIFACTNSNQIHWLSIFHFSKHREKLVHILW